MKVPRARTTITRCERTEESSSVIRPCAILLICLIHDGQPRRRCKPEHAEACSSRGGFHTSTPQLDFFLESDAFHSPAKAMHLFQGVDKLFSCCFQWVMCKSFLSCPHPSPRTRSLHVCLGLDEQCLKMFFPALILSPNFTVDSCLRPIVPYCSPLEALLEAATTEYASISKLMFKLLKCRMKTCLIGVRACPQMSWP